MSHLHRLHQPGHQVSRAGINARPSRGGGLSCLLLCALAYAGCSDKVVYDDCNIYDTADFDHDGQTEVMTTYTYDDDEHLASISLTYEYYGERYEYSETYDYGAGRLPSHVTISQTYEDESSTFEVTFAYAADNPDHLTTAEYDIDGDGVAEAVAQYTYSSDGQTATSIIDVDGDGKAEDIATYQFYDYPLYPLLLTLLTDDTDGDGGADTTFAYTFNENGLLATIMFDTNDDGELDATETLSYDDHDNVTRIVTKSTAWSSSYWIDEHFGGNCYE